MGSTTSGSSPRWWAPDGKQLPAIWGAMGATMEVYNWDEAMPCGRHCCARVGESAGVNAAWRHEDFHASCGLSINVNYRMVESTVNLLKMFDFLSLIKDTILYIDHTDQTDKHNNNNHLSNHLTVESRDMSILVWSQRDSWFEIFTDMYSESWSEAEFTVYTDTHSLRVCLMSSPAAVSVFFFTAHQHTQWASGC